MPLNPEQEIIANHHDGPMLGISVAGSGKTTTMVQNLLNKYREKGVNPMRVFVTAFNKDVADELRARIVRSGFPGLPKFAPIGTSHSLFRKILIQEGLSYEGIITEWAGRDLILSAIGKKRYKNGEEAQILGKIGWCKNSCLYYKPLVNTDAHDRFLDTYPALAEECDVDPEDFLKAFAAYEVGKQQKKMIDMDDMLFQTWVMFLRYPERLKRWQAQYDHVLIDEYQDTNPVQYDLYRMLAWEHNNVIALGDDDQAIYGFRGASPTYIRSFLSDYPDARYVTMQSNYRSQHGVLDAANLLIVHNKDRYDKTLQGVKPYSHRPEFHQCEDERHEADVIARHLKDHHSANWEEVAVLTRVNTQQAWIEEAFVRHGIPYTIVRGTSFFRRKEVVVLTNYLRYAQNPTIALARELANKPYRFIGNDKANGWRDFEDFSQDARVDANVARLYEELDWVENAYRRESIGAILDFVINRPCYLGSWAIKSASLTSDVSPAALIQQFVEMTAGHTVDEALDMIDAILRHYEEDDRHKVRVGTIHAAKGLEWDTVYVPGLNDELLPHKSATDIEEERRLAYVALTRARKNLILTGHRQLPPSQFLSEIMDTLEVHTHEAPSEKAPALVVQTRPEPVGPPVRPIGGPELVPLDFGASHWDPRVEDNFAPPLI